ncbi:hypothetical protein [Halalkalibacter nanhaiisediminis]|uniref:Uncharacterized protein n=1 Tax=Halalkalibacter nanhaiisediminis TaxID=688079 RepID=A0A562QHV2_9BACI|nr:hypothetical protein [Halalkalibacter nanhaiisediminis]TWI56324.1 hypothetical protein IQ10_02218 [Halalkalibacter nanhaiisediminis]
MKHKKGLGLLALSFFKSEKIDYYFDQRSIIFSCFSCDTEIAMDVTTTNWECNYCSTYGKLTTLISMLEKNKKTFELTKKVYKPSIARREINQSFERLMKLSNEQQLKELTKLRSEIDILIDYLLRKQTS